jgi:biopolymer transport protein ExbD
MRIETPAPVRKPLPLTPLVDVVFLLLMFFMLSSTFTRFGDLDISRPPEAAAQAPSQEKTAAIPGVIINVAKGPRIKVNGAETAVADIAAKLDDYYGKGVRAGAIMLSSSAEVQDLVSVLEQARSSKLRAISVIR